MATTRRWFGVNGDWAAWADWISSAGSHLVPGSADDVTTHDSATTPKMAEAANTRFSNATRAMLSVAEAATVSAGFAAGVGRLSPGRGGSLNRGTVVGSGATMVFAGGTQRGGAHGLPKTQHRAGRGSQKEPTDPGVFWLSLFGGEIDHAGNSDVQLENRYQRRLGDGHRLGCRVGAEQWCGRRSDRCERQYRHDRRRGGLHGRFRVVAGRHVAGERIADRGNHRSGWRGARTGREFH